MGSVLSTAVFAATVLGGVFMSFFFGKVADSSGTSWRHSGGCETQRDSKFSSEVPKSHTVVSVEIPNVIPFISEALGKTSRSL